MTDKPTGARAAAREIPEWMMDAARELVGVIFKGYAVRSDYNGPEIVAAIILKYCPPDKAAGLVEISKRLSEWVRGLAGERLKEDVRKLLEDFEAALAEHEGDKHD